MLLLGLPPLASQKHGARYFVLSARVIRNLPPRQAKGFRSGREAESVTPPPTNELGGVGAAVLVKCVLPQRVRSHIELFDRPNHTVATLAQRYAREKRLIAQPAIRLESPHLLAQIDSERLAICKAQSKPELAGSLDA
jgi:hypothetical protein